MLEQDERMLIVNSFCGVADAMHNGAIEFYGAMTELRRPSAIWKPRLSIDGNQWCALYGENLQDGVAGFGDSPDAAMRDFDKQWNAKLQIER